MGRKLDIDHLVGSNEIAKRLGFRHPQLVHHHKNHDPTFPEPVLALGRDRASTHIWYWPDVERWAMRTGRLPKPTSRSRSDPKDGERADAQRPTAEPTGGQ